MAFNSNPSDLFIGALARIYVFPPLDICCVREPYRKRSIAVIVGAMVSCWYWLHWQKTCTERPPLAFFEILKASTHSQSVIWGLQCQEFLKINALAISNIWRGTMNLVPIKLRFL